MTFSNNTSYEGGGIFLLFDGTTSSSPIIENSLFTSNSVSQRGGGLLVGGGCEPVVKNTIFEYNEAQTENGGGIMFAWSGGTLTDVTIENNNSGYFGGGMWANQSYELMLSGVSFIGNTAAQNGGGWASHVSDAEFSDCLFENNTASVSIQDGNEFGGGAMWLVAVSYTHLTLPTIYSV